MTGFLRAANTILYCRHWEKTVRFYRDGLDLPIDFAADWFVEFRLTETARLSIAAAARTTVQSAGGAGITITLEVEDIDAAREQARQRGLEPTPIRKHPWNARLFHLRDPEGHRIEFWQAIMPGKQQDHRV
ncbi:MAG: VOC family protein [Deltaproteobacteria bacterium]|nr:VOC family protein [Candidatus Anaeroferrophillacea bacterium]